MRAPDMTAQQGRDFIDALREVLGLEPLYAGDLVPHKKGAGERATIARFAGFGNAAPVAQRLFQ